MKKYLILATTLLFMGSSGSAWAQAGYDAKSRDTTLGQARYDYGIEPGSRQRAEVTQDEPGLEILGIEPAAGDGRNEFTGPYFGADVGYSMGTYESNPNAGDVGLDGWLVNGFIGYGYAMGGRGVLGGYGALELAYELSDASGDLNANNFEKKSAIKALVKPGLMAQGSAVGYGIVGYSRAEFEGNGIDEILNGLVLGVGSEFNTGLPLRMRVEYTYTNFEDANFGAVSFDGHESNITTGVVLRL